MGRKEIGSDCGYWIIGGIVTSRKEVIMGGQISRWGETRSARRISVKKPRRRQGLAEDRCN